MKRLLALLVLIILVAIPLQAEKYALLVGINDYPDEISSLKYCVADVEAFSQALVEVAGFGEKNVYLMTSRMSGRKEPTHVNVIRQLSLLSGRVKAEDTFIFYFSGHGITKAGQSFLLTTNSDTTTKDTLIITAVDLNQVNQILSRIQAHQLLTVIDACRNDPDSGRGEEDNLLTNDFSRGFKIQRRGDNSGTPSVSATLYACNIGERAYEWADKGHGVFSYYLLQGLKGKAANSRGEVVVTDLADYTQREVMRWAEDFRGKKQTPWLDQSGGAKLVLVENRLGAVQAERSRLEEELAQVQRQLQQAEGANSAVLEAEARQQEAELQEKVRRAKAEEAVERQREKAAQQQREEEAREQRQQILRQAEAREQARREQAEVERQRQRLEAERQRLESQQLESMDIGQLLKKAKELQDKIDQVGPQVRGEVNRQIAAIPRTGKTRVAPKDEFETQAMYQQRLQKARQGDRIAEERYQREVGQIRATVDSEIRTRSQGYQEALSLLNRELVLDEREVALSLGGYDAERQVFAEAVLSVKSNREVESLPWVLKVALAEAKQFKESVSNETVKVRAEVEIEAESQRGRIESAVVEDLVQGLRYEVVRGMVLIPAGSFTMGSRDGGPEDEKPVHRVELDAFYMDVHEVRVGQFRDFVNQSGYEYGGNWNDVAKYSPGDEYPMVYVNWNDATAYAKWTGKRLPTEAEWEYAARGGLVGKRYPWGDEGATAEKANYGNNVGKPTVVGSYPANGYGLYDMAGNVWEWCADWYGSDYYSKSSAKNPLGPGTGSGGVLRGGSWGSDASYLRGANRFNYAPDNRSYFCGFRCVSGLR